jgi:hypothetical protein
MRYWQCLFSTKADRQAKRISKTTDRFKKVSCLKAKKLSDLKSKSLKKLTVKSELMRSAALYRLLSVYLKIKHLFASLCSSILEIKNDRNDRDMKNRLHPKHSDQ